jgi:hypothetical protein
MSDLRTPLISLKNVDVSITTSENDYLLVFSKGADHPHKQNVQLKLPYTHISVNEVPVDNSPVQSVMVHQQQQQQSSAKPSRLKRRLQRSRERNAQAERTARRNGTYPLPGAPKLLEWQVAEIKSILADKDLRSEHRSDYALYKELGTLYKVTGACINAIDKGVTWKNVGPVIKA